MSESETVQAESGGTSQQFTLDWNARRWTSPVEHDFAAFPFVADVRGKRYELYSDGSFDEEDLTPDQEAAAGP